MTERIYYPKRRFPRIPAKNTVLVTKLDGQSHEEFAKTKSLGLGGCMFTSDQCFGEETVLEMLITIGLDVIKTKVKVVYERQSENDEKVFEIGVEFVDIRERDQKTIERMLIADRPD
jgi:c-di-GMP-binding flagellar brake protein YcgR